MKVRILPAEFILQSKFFDYLSQDEKQENFLRVKNKLAIVVAVEKNDYLEYVSILDLDDAESIHVREVNGKFSNTIQALEIFATALAAHFKKQYVTFCAKRDGVKWLGEKLGFEERNEVFYKEVKI